MNHDWKFWYCGYLNETNIHTELEKADWKVISIPHTWNAEISSDTSSYSRGVGIYQKQWFVPQALKGKRIFMHFEGANQICKLYVNQGLVGKHIGGYTAFTFEISDFVRFGEENEITISVDNSFNQDIPPLSADFTFYGGIYRDIWLLVTEPVHISLDKHGSSGIYISTPVVTDKQAEISIRVIIKNQSNKFESLVVENTVINPEGEVIKKIKSNLDIPAQSKSILLQENIIITSPALWSPKHPRLYSLVTQIYSSNGLADQLEHSFGLRYYELDSDNGFIFNGETIKLIGINRHQDFQGLGNALPNRIHVSDLTMIKDAGFNFLRLAHYPQDPVVLQTADSLGLIIWEEIPIVNYVTTSEAFKNNSLTMCREMILQHYNHPSIVFWGYMNEVFLYDVNGERGKKMAFPEEYLTWTVGLAQELDDMVKKVDPGRLSVLANHQNRIYDEVNISNIPDATGYNLYPGWYSGKFSGFKRFLDKMHKTYPKRNIIVSEYGAGSDDRIHSYKPLRFDFSTEYQQLYHESYLEQINVMPYLSATAVWAQNDFGSDGRGDSRAKLNQKGLQYFNRHKKDIYFLYKATLKDEPLIRIASHDWTVRRIIGEISTIPLKIYTNVSPIEVFVNDRSQGKYDVKETHILNININAGVGKNKIQAIGYCNNLEIVDSVNIEFIQSKKNGKPANDLLAINIGSNCEYLADNEVLWMPEQEYVTGQWGYVGGTTRKHGKRKPVLGTTDEYVYQTYREGVDQFRYDLPDGRYRLELCFAENSIIKAGERVFTIYVNQEKAWNGIDLIADYGINQAVNLSEEVTVANGDGLAIQFEAQKGQTLLNGVKIRELGNSF